MRIVIADDEQYIRTMFTEQYNWWKYGISVEGIASNGEEAYDMTLRVNPHVLLTDIRMPKMNGLDLMRALKDKLPDLKVVYLTGWSNFDYAREALRLGASDYLVKPCSEQELIASLLALKDDISTGDIGDAAGRSGENLNAQRTEKKTHAVNLACEKIRQDLSRALTLTEIAEYVSMNPSSFSRLFRREMGTSFSVYLTSVRMNEAKKLLIETNDKIHDIAKQVGYVSSSHFVQIFGEYAGMTPGRFREING